MIKALYVMSALLAWIVLSCKKEKNREGNFGKFLIDKGLAQNDTIKLLSKFPELKLFPGEKPVSKTRSAYVIQNLGIHAMDNYKCNAVIKNDTLQIWINNSNSYFGNGVLINIVDGHFVIKDIDPKTLHSEIKFIKTKPLHQKLVLNKADFLANDSIYGFIDYKTKVDSFTKDFRGYFKTVIQ
ncbi:hypothetical protein MKJ01_03445 [Chryseobacterium sp. SSA4.19]|uniref:hypothetical protein n=1 Tax=Chryseobacterium sp. SSA4.19 TaxID=2919915 RepID=UPI001F4DC1EA|nr:hypothetical protein [Chryseobacterium sp. SSA4.19]MCJ8152819.1 hypothetical protein [Chryseobacterium sp. SSA4.19]